LEWLARLGFDDFRDVFRGTPVKRTKHAGMLRNVAIAMGNSGEARFLATLEELRQHDDPAVAESADWAVRRIRSGADSTPDE
jgi:epoxyqueuosine reductase